MAYSTQTFSTTGLKLLTSGARDVVSTAVITIQGIGTASLTFQSRHNVDGNGTNPLTPSNIAYSVLGGAGVTAGTAITADGRFEVNTDASDLYLNITALNQPFTVYITSLQGGGGGGGSGGGSGGAITIANGADVAEGSTTDTPQAVAATTAAATQIALLKGIYNNTFSASSSTVVPTTTVDPTNTFTQPTGDAAGRSIFTVTQGLIADGATASGVSSVLIGGIDSGGLARSGLMSLISATPVSTATYGLLTYSVMAGVSSGNTIRSIVTGTGFTAGGSGATSPVMIEARASNTAGTTYEQAYNNLNGTILTSGARTTTQTSADQTNFNHRGIAVVLDMTTVGTGSVTISINGKDAVSGKYYTILAGAAVTTNVTNVYKVYPGASAVANVSANDLLPRSFQIVVTANNANSATYSVGYSLIS